jgi:hypothetical protein
MSCGDDRWIKLRGRPQQQHSVSTHLSPDIVACEAGDRLIAAKI